MKKGFKLTEYLYGVPPHTFSDLPYKTALSVKMDCAKRLLKLLQSLPIQHRDLHRIADVYDAIRFNRSLLEEIGEAK